MIIKKGFVTLFLAGLLTFVLGTAAPNDLFAGSKEVTIKVDGLACPFCAYGLEKKLKRLEGMEKIKIFINEGKVTLAFKDGVSISKEEIERAVDEGGFTPREIVIIESSE